MKSSKAIVEGYMKRKDWRVKENSNSPYSFGAMGKYITAEVSKDYWLHEVYPEHISQAYVDGYIHIHDLGGLTLYCCGYSLKDIFWAGEMAALVAVHYFWFAVCKCIPTDLQYEPDIQRIVNLPADHIPAKPVNNGNQIQK